ncbi:hypothetical protein [uncultured Shimia sp.]|uniref:hypothetical protein n=1 Tax=uncultured Shimia sp. TaxID=573152 RepID=UPI0026383E5E|nr:hypothetical protein [uncultured Shimia sp.]
MRFLGVLLCFGQAFGAPVWADILPVPYADLEKELSSVLTFETLPQRSEPGFNFDHLMRLKGAWVGEHFAGQTLGSAPSETGQPHDTLSEPQASAPLTLRTGAPWRNLSIAHHRGFGSNAVLPLGPLGFQDISGRGEGAFAVLFDHDQPAFGFRLHAAYDSPLGQASMRGSVVVHVFDRQGNLIGRASIHPGEGVSEHGFRTLSPPHVAGIMITNTDPGGIALDDILFQIERMLF